MSLLETLRELVRPGSIRHRSLRPMEAGLRPDSRLDDAVLLTEPAAFEPECLAVLGGDVYFSHGSALYRLAARGHTADRFVELGGELTALASDGAELVASVVGRGVVRVAPSGTVREISTDARLRSGLTDLCIAEDGRIFATQGSASMPFDQMIDAQVRADASGMVLEISPSVRVVADRLPWPSGVGSSKPDGLMVALANAHSIITMATDGRIRSTVQDNLPFYPGRFARASDGGFWLAVPYVRNRATELILDEPELRAEMVAGIARSEWLVPRLRSETPHTDALQMGQLRMLGVLKPWAPPRSYGLIAHLDAHGRFDRSAHSRPDGRNHGVTHVVEHDGRAVMAVRGRRAVASIEIGGAG